MDLKGYSAEYRRRVQEVTQEAKTRDALGYVPDA